MKYNFDELVDRKGTDSIKWDVKEGELPLWVADMDFRVATEITDAIKKRVENGIFGYTYIDSDFKDAVVYHWQKCHNHTINKSSILFSHGAVPSFASILKEFTHPGESVLLSSPAYNAFYNVIRNNGRNVVENSLLYKNGTYKIDFKDLENKMKRSDVSLFILCNPHNPTGNIWTKTELLKIARLAKKYSILVISDEIHCDIVDPGLSYTPYASISKIARENSITLISATKAFNLAGIQSSILYTDNDVYFERMKRALNNDELCEPNSFAPPATIAAFREGDEWLSEMCEYVYKNKCFVREFFKNNLPQLKVVNGGATYLLWIDISAYTDNSEQFCKKLREKTGLFVSNGMMYGKTDGKGFFRLNVATPLSILTDALNRLKAFIEAEF